MDGTADDGGCSVAEDPSGPAAGSIIDAVLRLCVREEPGAVVTQVHGEVDLLTAPRLAAELVEQVDGRSPVVVADLSEVDFFGAAGLEALSQAQRSAERSGVSLRLVAGPQVRRLLTLVRLDRPLPVHDTLADAVR
jgi:anti-anti-sigma factor